MTRRFKAVIAYDGTHYEGWQVQPGKRTIQGELAAALSAAADQPVSVLGSGRTDAGVHARAQVAHFDLARPVDVHRLRQGGNAGLEPSIRILRVTRAPASFNSRHDATGKEYRYFIYNGEEVPPFLRLYRHHQRAPLDLEAMRRAAAVLVGRHDFAAFSANPRREVDSTVRSLHRLVVRGKGPEITLVAVGEGFLYKMVRSLAGCLLRAGRGELDPAAVREILDSRERTARVPTAPARGLFLWAVRYGRRPGGPAPGAPDS